MVGRGNVLRLITFSSAKRTDEMRTSVVIIFRGIMVKRFKKAREFISNKLY